MPLTKENQSIYSNHLHTVQNIKFSTKELAVISCIIHNRGTKKIANLLFISPNTVKSHTQNIMRKMNCNSRESIIDIIENSGKLVYFRQYYTNILIIALFRETLIKIAKIYIKDSLLLHINSSPGLNLDKIPIFQQLRIDLNLVNITIYQDKNTEENIIKINVVVDKMFNLQSIIFDKDRGEKTIDFQGSKIYYFAVLELLTAIVDKPGVVNFLEEFKKNYNILKTSVILPESVTPGDESVDKISLVHYDLINNKFKIFTLILLVCLVSHIVYANRIYIKSKIVSNTPVELSIITNEVAANNDIIKWNIPKCFEYYVNRPEVIAKIWQILQSKLYKKNITKITGLSGLGGIGKTTLAKLLINNPRIHYKFLAWFNADNEDVLRKSYFALGNNFNIFPANISDEAKIVLVQEWMSHQDKILIVYDNVPDISILEKFLPSKGHIIITSRHYQIPGMLALDVMTQDQSIDLLNRLIPESIQKSQNYSSNLKTLAKKLNYIPLALVQAGSYITENMINIEKYLDLFSVEKNLLLRKDLALGLERHLPIYTSWDLSLSKILRHKLRHKVLSVLHIISLCHTEHLPNKLLAQYLFDNNDVRAMIKLNEVLSLLNKYSFIQRDSNSISVHSLVHWWLKDKISGEEENVTINKLIKSLKEIYPISIYKTTEDINFLISLLPHIKQLLSNKYTNKEHHSLLELFIGDIYHTLGDFKQSAENFSKVADFYMANSPNSNEVIFIYYILGKLNIELGNYLQAQVFFRKAQLLINDNDKSKYNAI